MRQRLKPLWTATSGLLFCLAVVIETSRACGPMLYSEEARFSLFQPASMTLPALLPFQYTHDNRMKFDFPKPPDDRVRNIQEWLQFGKHQFDSADSWILQYHTAPDTFQEALSNKQGGTLRDNSFMQWLLKKKNKKALRYFSYAKKVEAAQNPNWENQWDQLYRDQLAVGFDSLAVEGLRLLRKEKTPFLKARYAFQFVKCAYYAAFYGGERTETETKALVVFDRYLSKSTSIVGQWAWIYYADLQEDPLQRTRYFLEAFERSNEKKVRAFQLLSLAELDTLLKVEKNPAIQVTALSLILMKTDGPGLSSLQELYRLQPDHPYLPLLISREINKLEDWLWSPDILRFQPNQRLNAYYSTYYRLPEDQRVPYEQIAKEQWLKDREYLKQIRGFLLEIYGSAVSGYNGFLPVAIAHLYNMDDRHADASAMLQHLDGELKPALQLQVYYEQLIASLYQKAPADTATQKQQLALLLQKIKTLQRRLSDSAHFTEAACTENKVPELYAYLGRHFLEKGDALSGCMLLQQSDLLQNEYAYKPYDSTSYGGLAFLEKYASPEDLDALIRMKHKKDKSLFEQLISPQIWLTDGMYLDLKGTLLLRSEQYEAAYKVFDRMEDNFWETTYAFSDYLPHTTVTDLGRILPVASGTGRRYSRLGKKAVLKEILALKKSWTESNDPEGRAKAGFHLANALYNISYYGDAWMVSAYGQSASEPFRKRSGYMSNYKWVYYYMPETGYSRPENYYGLAHAIKLYRAVAASEEADRETRAGATLMLAYCDRLSRSYFQEDPISADPDQGIPASAYLKIFKRNYADTRLYTAARTHCPDLF